MSVMDADSVEVEKGDMVCLHTGFADVCSRWTSSPTPKVLRADLQPASTAATTSCCSGSPTRGLAC